jgi:hypothetical protein
MWSRTSRSTHESGRAAQVSRASHEGQVFGCNPMTSRSWTPRVVSQRDRGTPLTAGVRRTLGLTKGRLGVQSTIGRAPTRRTACTRARSWVRRGATTSVRSPPVPAWNSLRSRATGTPHPDRCAVGWPKAACKAEVSSMAHPEPSTRQVRWPCHRPSSKADRCTARPKRSSRRSKKHSGSLARA